MAKEQLPGFYRKRKVLFGKHSTAEELRKMGQQFMEAGRFDDALEFFQRAGAADLTRAVADKAMADGNVPLYWRAKKVLKEAVTEAEWTQLAANAEKAGMYSCALLAHQQAGHQEEQQRLRKMLHLPEPIADRAITARPLGRKTAHVKDGNKN